MPLPKPNPGDSLRAAEMRDVSLYAEASKPIAGKGISVRRTPRGSVISISPVQIHLPPSGLDSEFPNGTVVWGRVAYDQENNKFVQYKAAWDSETRTFVEIPDQTPADIIEGDSHVSQHS